MTTKTSKEVTKRRRRIKPKKERRTFKEDLRESLAAQTEAVTRITFPSPRYRNDPVGFAHDILGVTPWSRQVEVLEAIRDHPRVAVKSGHKVSKSHTAAIIALWFYCSFEDARVVMTSTTSRQVDAILWRELRMMKARGGICLKCKKENEGRSNKDKIKAPCPHSSMIDGVIGELARTGLKSHDFREVVGFTAREAEAVAGVSGANLLYILDEASGIAPVIFEAIEGNRAGGAKIVMFSNPTRTTGDFFDAFNDKKRFYSTHTISSEETPNVIEGKKVVPGLATREWVEEKKDEWGEDSPMYKIRVKGEFVLGEDGKIFSVHTVSMAEQRWYDVQPLDSDRLYIGLDPAGEKGTGDPTAAVVRRGYKMLQIFRKHGLSEEAHVAHLLSMIAAHKRPREVPVVVVDREGAVGAKVYGFLAAYVSKPNPPFELVAMRASDGAHREPHIYDRARDEMVANLLRWVGDGGGILEDKMLSQEMRVFEWIKQERTGRLKVTPKKEVKKILGRSCDTFDAATLSVWEPARLRDEKRPERENTFEPEEHVQSVMDPYAGLEVWGG